MPARSKATGCSVVGSGDSCAQAFHPRACKNHSSNRRDICRDRYSENRQRLDRCGFTDECRPRSRGGDCDEAVDKRFARRRLSRSQQRFSAQPGGGILALRMRRASTHVRQQNLFRSTRGRHAVPELSCAPGNAGERDAAVCHAAMQLVRRSVVDPRTPAAPSPPSRRTDLQSRGTVESRAPVLVAE